MLGESHKEITPETADLVAELLNIIYGQAKTELNAGLGLDLPPALPTVLRGEKLSLRQNSSAPVVVLPFQSDLGIFHVEIATMPTESKIQRSA
jgi:chemotaxis protein CheX